MPTNSNRRQVLRLISLLSALCGLHIEAQIKPQESELVRIKRLEPYLLTPKLIGQGKYTYWGFDVYTASLWASDTPISPDRWHTQRVALELQYLRDFKGADIAKRSIDEINSQSSLPKGKTDMWLKILEGIFPNVAKGQTLTGIYIPNAGALFLSDSTVIGEIKDLELARRFFDIWLAQQTSASDLRKQLFSGI